MSALPGSRPRSPSARLLVAGLTATWRARQREAAPRWHHGVRPPLPRRFPELSTAPTTLSAAHPAAGALGELDLARAITALTRRLPPRLTPLAELAYNYRWSWTAGEDIFRTLSPHRWELCGHNPVAMLHDLSETAVSVAAGNGALLERIDSAVAELRAELTRPHARRGIGPEHPVAFLCAEFGIHASLPIYSGGLGVLAGDILKQASDSAIPMVGIGLLYRQGYFRQRLDTTGWQHEYWTSIDPYLLPAVRVNAADGLPLLIEVPIGAGTVVAQVWRIDVGRTPLFLLDAERPENRIEDRWITARLYVSDRAVRLRQYALLGTGGARLLQALGISPGVVHLNEGHAVTATIEDLRSHLAAGTRFDDAVSAVRAHTVFTTHTPVPAGNESYPRDQVFESLLGPLGDDTEGVLHLAAVDAADPGSDFGLSPLAIRMSRSTNGVSRRHGEVARGMWAPIFPGLPGDEVPIRHVTNGVHVPTWMSAPMRRLLDKYLGEDWLERVTDPRTWDAVDNIPNAELWETRSIQRAQLVDFLRDRSVRDRLDRGSPLPRAVAAQQSLNDGALTIGCARRIATYKRLHLLTLNPERAIALISGDRPVQVVVAGKAHPQDDSAKQLVRDVFEMNRVPDVSRRTVFVDDYDMSVAARLVAGCDLWLNMPLPPMEASGTSGMKAALNGCLNLSVLDGWWEEAYDGSNGWGVHSPADLDPGARDAADSAELFRLLESEIVPLFQDRDADGVPHGWVQRMKSSLRTIGPRFSATRMLDEYVTSIYATEAHTHR